MLTRLLFRLSRSLSVLGGIKVPTLYKNQTGSVAHRASYSMGTGEAIEA